MKIKIHKGVPMPKGKTQRRYPLNTMPVGSMFWLPSDVEAKGVCGNANARYKPRHFEWRRVGKRQGIWRTK